MESLELMLQKLSNNDLVVLIRVFTNTYILSPLSKTEFTSNLIQSSASRFVTALLIYGGIFLAIYETILHFGVAMNWWKNPADEVFKEIPVHCAHVYVSINLLKDGSDDEESEGNEKDDKKEDKKENNEKTKYLLKYPIVYHFEFSPDEYAHEEYGTDLKFLKGKVHNWFESSEVYYHHKKDIGEISTQDLSFYNKKGKLIRGDDEYLCDLGVDTGDTIYCVIHY
ncbi:hypothetical protein C6P42_004313 [Pichia californica]|nr:hypothetical protein C6P42_004313 [[Candida] californica]